MRKAGDIITALFKDRFGPEFMNTARTTSGLFSSWAQVVADVWPRPFYSEQETEDIPAAAAHSQIRELELGVLLVEADHPGWIQILQTKQGELLSAVQRRYPEMDIRGIAFRLSREPFFSREGHGSAAEQTTERATVAENQEPLPAHIASRDAPRDEEFYAALKGLEKSIKKRNGL